MSRRRACLLSQHAKETVMFPILAEALDLELQVNRDFDTDQLGSFCRSVPRAGSALDAAREKARIALALSAADIGLGSEGSFGAGPLGPFLTWNCERVLWLEPAIGLEVVGLAQGPSPAEARVIESMPALETFLAGLEPGQGLILRPDHSEHPMLEKGLVEPERIRASAERLFDLAETGRIFVEYDCRAHLSPARRRRIAEATENLVARLNTRCPVCAAPDFWDDRAESGLPCQTCHWPTQVLRGRWRDCRGCGHQRFEPAPADHADPGHCPRCNP